MTLYATAPAFPRQHASILLPTYVLLPTRSNTQISRTLIKVAK